MSDSMCPQIPNTRITVRCDIMGDIFAWDRCTVLEWGTVR